MIKGNGFQLEIAGVQDSGCLLYLQYILLYLQYISNFAIFIFSHCALMCTGPAEVCVLSFCSIVFIYFGINRGYYKAARRYEFYLLKSS